MKAKQSMDGEATRMKEVCLAAESDELRLGTAGIVNMRRRRLIGLMGFLAALLAAFVEPIYVLIKVSAASELNSYILLVPFISGYLIWEVRQRKTDVFGTSPVLALAAGLTGAAAVISALSIGSAWTENDRLSLLILGLVSFVYCGYFAVLGFLWVRSNAFPTGFLIFLAPLPDAAVRYLEGLSIAGSTVAAAWIFDIFNVPVLRTGTSFQLSDISIRVAQECSGIHSSLVLVLASLIGGYFMLRTFWRRALLAVCAILFGVVRNGFRIAFLGWLCVHNGPAMIDSPIHHQGGPVFFVLSLVPLLAVLGILFWTERRSRAAGGDDVVSPRASGLPAKCSRI